MSTRVPHLRFDGANDYPRRYMIFSELVMKNRYEMRHCEKRRNCPTRSTAVRYRITGSRRAPVSRPRGRKEKRDREKRAKSRADRRNWCGARSAMYAPFSLHTVYCNINVRHCNKNANSFVTRRFSSPARLPLARASANERGGKR